MKKKILLFLILIIFIFSSCSSNNSQSTSFFTDNKNGAITTDNSGNGLEISIDDKLNSKNLELNLDISNSGKEPIELSKENFKMYTIEQTQNGENIFTKNSLDIFYNKLFKDSTLVLNQNQNKKAGGVLRIKEIYYNDLKNSKFEYVIETNYNYRTDFSNNFLLDLNSNSKLQLQDTLSQAAPVKITEISSDYGVNDNEYNIKFTISKDSNFQLNSQTSSIVKFDFIDLYFNQNYLQNCIYIDDGGNEIKFENLRLNNIISSFDAICSINLREYIDSKTNVIISGKLKYNFKEKIIKRIEFSDRNKNQYSFQ